MAQQSSLTFFENANSQPDFTVVLRGYDRPQVDDFVQRLNAALAQSEAARAEAEQLEVVAGQILHVRPVREPTRNGSPSAAHPGVGIPSEA